MQRERYVMPDFIKQSLDEQNLLQKYQARPPYQQNDYIGWILSAKKIQTRERRLKQMLDELAAGGVYMKMKHPASLNK